MKSCSPEPCKHVDSLDPPEDTATIHPKPEFVYKKTSRFVSVGTQTEDHVWPTTSSPIKSTENTVNDTFSFCDSKIQSDDDSEYFPDCSFEDVGNTGSDIINEKKFVVFEGMLDKLFKLIICQKCHLPAENITKSILGTSIHCKLYCQNEHLITDWKSQPLLGKLPSFNLLISATIFFSGSTYEIFKKPVTFAGLNFVNPTTYYNIQRTLVIPSINRKFDECIKAAREEIKTSATQVILGDGKFEVVKILYLHMPITYHQKNHCNVHHPNDQRERFGAVRAPRICQLFSRA